MAFVDVLTHPGILRRRAAGNLPVGIEEEEIYVEGLIEEELTKPQYQPYLEACERCGFGAWLSAVLVASVFPFNQFLTDDGKPRIVYTTTQKGKRARKDESLRSFKMACGMGLSWISSGDFEGWVAGGNGVTRRNLYMAITAAYTNQKRGIIERPELELVKHRYDRRGIMKVARHWVEDLYRELKLEFIR